MHGPVSFSAVRSLDAVLALSTGILLAPPTWASASAVLLAMWLPLRSRGTRDRPVVPELSRVLW